MLSPSNYHWVNYDDQKLTSRYFAWKASQRGVDLHKLAQDCIRLNIKVSKAEPTMSKYVHDGIAYQMNTEQPLYYSPNCFGTVDCISFRRGTLRIHDLKTGIIKASFTQLKVYAALFCLEYGISPYDIKMEFRIYQNGKVDIEIGDPDAIGAIMDTIVDFDIKIEMLKEGETL